MARTKKTARSDASQTSKGRPVTPAERKEVPKGKKNITFSSRPRKAQPYKKVFQELKKYQKSVDLLIRKLPFQRLVREVTNDIRTGLRFRPAAILALQVYFYLIIQHKQLCSSSHVSSSNSITGVLFCC